MANKNALNKNSVYVQSLVDFILDTKPYHSKLTEIVEEYRFYDDVNVKIEERLNSKTKISPNALFNYFSSENPLYRETPAKRLVSPAFSIDTFDVGVDENKDLALVPYAYSKKGFDGVGVNNVFIRHDGFSEPLIQSIDFFTSKGSFQFQIKQTFNAAQVFDPQWVSTADDGVIGIATTTTQALALDKTNPKSAWNQIHNLLDEIKAAAVSIGGHTDVETQLTLLYNILNIQNTLPRSYEALLGWLAIPNANGVLVPLPHEREWYEQKFSNLTSPLFFNMFTDMSAPLEERNDARMRESGKTDYVDTKTKYIAVSNIVLNMYADVQEWTLENSADDLTLYKLTGSTSGVSGFIRPGQPFDNGRISFDTSLVSTPTDLDSLTLSPTRKLLISPTAPLETWNIIKTNPLAHSRPKFTSSTYGSLSNVTILDQSIPTTDIILTSRGDNFFDLTSSAEPNYKQVVEVGKPFNDGRLKFTVIGGPRSFAKNERYYISIENLPAQAKNLDIGYGYDLDPYDDDVSTYPTGDILGFYFDGRFTDYDLSRLNLQISQSAINGRKWRARAMPDFARQIGTFADPSNAAASLLVYYAAKFVLEYSDDDFQTSNYVADIPIDGSYSSSTHGISFSIPSASRPFIAASADSTGETRALGGDTISFEVFNPPPVVKEAFISSTRFPYLIMHSGDFYTAPAATWTLTFTSADQYILSAVAKTGETLVSGVTCTLSTPSQTPYEGHSFKGFGVHYTVMPGDGFTSGDTFTFETYDTKPSYLVHGSVTGWTQPATVGKFYWNGKIGFKINPPVLKTYVNGLPVDLGVDLTVREDCPSITYSFNKTTKGFTVVRSANDEMTFVEAGGTFQDKWLTAKLNAVNQSFTVFVNAHDYPLWNSSDIVIVNPPSAGRLPKQGEVVVVEKTEFSKLELNMAPGHADISPLGPVTIDQRFIDLNTRGLPLSNTSPETALLQGWIPLMVKKFDSDTSIAEFSDPATKYVFTSSVSNEPVGTLKQKTLNLNEPIVFEWDEAFYTKYLPLNAEANLFLTDTGWNDKVHARITESVKFLISGGALDEDWMFHDDVHVSFSEETSTFITANWDDPLNLQIKDGPFGGFLPGFGNMPYDAELVDGTGSYDAGIPLNLESLLANVTLTDEDRENIFDMWDNFLQTHQVPTTQDTIDFMRAALAGDTTGGLISSEIGYPVVGKGFDIVDSRAGTTATRFSESMMVQVINNANHLDVNLLDQGLLDELDEETAIITYIGTLPPTPTSVPGGATYDSFDTQMFVATPMRVFQISFNGAPFELATLSPTFRFWKPEDPAPVQVNVVERVSPGVFRFMMARPTEGKIIIG